MNQVCRICLEPLAVDGPYHARCVRGLFGTARVPNLDLEVSKLHTAALAMVGHTSLSGVQKKISVGLSADRETLQVAAHGGRYILKPETETYPALPENEHLTTRLAALAGIEVAPSGLIALKDRSPAFIVLRFDRMTDGRKLRQEDFCQLAVQSPKEKYDGSAELCVRLLRKFATEPLVEIRKFFQRQVFLWWTCNGDMHLKNFSLLTDASGMVRLAPAYDMVCTRLVIPDDPLALPVCGKRSGLGREDWLRFAEYCQLPRLAAQRILSEQVARLGPALALVDRSFLPGEQQKEYRGFLSERTVRLET